DARRGPPLPAERRPWTPCPRIHARRRCPERHLGIVQQDMTMNSGKAAPMGAWRIFRIPVALGVVSLVGLTAALLGDGLWDGLSWLMLAIPLAVIAVCWWRGA